MPKTNVILVDDDEDVISSYRKKLESQGCNVDVITPGVDEITKIKGKKYDVALIDYLLTDLNRENLLRELKNINNKIQVMLLSEDPELKYRIYS
jgi:DNA-binding NtrC family response regulator